MSSKRYKFMVCGKFRRKTKRPHSILSEINISPDDMPLIAVSRCFNKPLPAEKFSITVELSEKDEKAEKKLLKQVEENRKFRDVHIKHIVDKVEEKGFYEVCCPKCKNSQTVFVAGSDTKKFNRDLIEERNKCPSCENNVFYLVFAE